MNQQRGARIARVEPGSPAAQSGIEAGQVLLSINGRLIRDVIDYRFYAAEESLRLAMRTETGQIRTVHILRDLDEDLGIEFESPTFDGIRLCHNRCEFCFVGQMPPGLRRSLYVRDDDYRYSFLFGNFVTLTNLTVEDWQRLGEQRLSPLYVSVHATDPLVRARVLGVSQSPDILDQLRRLGEMGIEAHTQIVVTPGVNDGCVLERSVTELVDLYPTVASVALVPIGLTRYHARGLRNVTTAEARRILSLARSRRRRCRERWGLSLVYPSDEFYLLAGQSVPAARTYDGFPQLENGVGLVRLLIDDWSRIRRRKTLRTWPQHSVTMVCGTLIAPTLSTLVAEWSERVRVSAQVVPVRNRFFGETVTVSGLLTAADVLETLRKVQLGDLVVLPRAMFGATEERTLDGWTLDRLQEELGVPTAMAGSLGDLAAPPGP